MATDTEKQLVEITASLKREAYAAGWRDAVAAMNKAVSQLAESPTAEINLGHDVAQTPDLTGGKGGGKPPTPGTTPYYILMEVKKNTGLTSGQIIEAVKGGGHTAPEPSIRTNIQRLKDRKLIALRHGKWWPL